ncbi:TlyA family RNA methyltransferase [Teredinibacter franksiae]|uniref:TlyA family RNA methyltransferase n=1 Tax=Teredinibacter franksiae TaxID=2761453 RepID=UPI001629DA8A|nr:TlyA family RNA methyltransferase [Teredinibacter franksiae]
MKRIDVLLVDNQLVKSRTEAQKLIAANLVDVREMGVWRRVLKSSEKFEASTLFKVAFSQEQKYVSRAGLKLEAALNHVQLSPEGAIALDIGQSTGGFTDCLLQQGAAQVVGIEVGRAQIASSLLSDNRVVTLEQYNARNLTLEDMPAMARQGFDIAVMDVSFISQHHILPRIPAVLKPGGHLLSLVKPQFEVGKDFVGKNGIVRDKASFQRVEQRIHEHLTELGFTVLAYLQSPIKGGDGNHEFLVAAQMSNNSAE